MKVLITKTLSAEALVDVPDDLPEEEQKKLAAKLADEMDIEAMAKADELYWVNTDFHRPAATPEEEKYSSVSTQIDGTMTAMWEWFDLG